MSEITPTTASSPNSFSEVFSKTVSVVFHPLILPTYLLVLAYLTIDGFFPISAEAFKYILALVFLGTCLIPVLSIYVMFRFRIIKSLSLQDPNQRVIPYFSTAVIYGLSLIYFQDVFALNPLITIMLGLTTLCIILTALITVFWKISAHAIGLGGTLGFTLLLINGYQATELVYFILWQIISTGVVLSARIRLGAHNLSQIAIGFILGFSICFLGGYLLFQL